MKIIICLCKGEGGLEISYPCWEGKERNVLKRYSGVEVIRTVDLLEENCVGGRKNSV